MCLVILAHAMSERYPLLVAANRDEFYTRPTAASHFWPDHPGVLAGRDEHLGGTWMGLSRDGRFAAITNYRDPDATAVAPRSRGELPLAFLTSGLSPAHYLDKVAAQRDAYAGFNLLVGRPGELWYLGHSASADDTPSSAPAQLPPGIYGLSNARLDTPWPKVEKGKDALASLLASGEVNHEALAQLVSDRQLADPERLQALGMDSEMEAMLSAQFIHTPGYGTRATTTVWQDDLGRLHWCERTLDENGVQSQKVEEVVTRERAKRR